MVTENGQPTVLHADGSDEIGKRPDRSSEWRAMMAMNIAGEHQQVYFNTGQQAGGNRGQIRIAGQDDAHGIRIHLLHAAQELHAARAGHALVGHDHLDALLGEDLHSCRGARCRMDRVAVAAQHAR